MTSVRKAALIIGAGLAIFGTTAFVTSVVLDNPSLLAALKLAPQSPAEICKTIATDPNPPLNVRSSPVSAPDNIIGKLKNGTQLTVVDENEGWLRVVAPIEGWVFKDLTVTSCIPASTAEIRSSGAADNSQEILNQATELYQAGNLDAAIALAQSIPEGRSAYPLAQGAIVQWQQDWKTAEAAFQAAQKATKQKKWQNVLNTVSSFPNNRYWRARLTPLVKMAIKEQNADA